MARKAKPKKAKIVGDPMVDPRDKRIVYCVKVGTDEGNAWEYKYTGDAALAMVNFGVPEVLGDKRVLIRNAVIEWRAANRDKYVGLLGQL